MVQMVFVTALTLVSALALALVYGLGGWYALRGTLEAGSVVTMALLLTRLYAPLTQLAGARVEVMSALVSFERVFEILDLKPLITETPDPGRGAGGSGLGRVRPRALRLPDRRQGLARLARGGRRPRQPRRRRGHPRRLVPRRARPDGRPRRLLGRGQVDHRLAAGPALRRRRRRGAHRRRRRPRPELRRDPLDAGHGDPGRPPVPRVDPQQPAARQGRRDRGRALVGPDAGPGSPT